MKHEQFAQKTTHSHFIHTYVYEYLLPTLEFNYFLIKLPCFKMFFLLYCIVVEKPTTAYSIRSNTIYKYNNYQIGNLGSKDLFVCV